MIDSNILLQTDATVIAGVLILITIYSLKPTTVRQLEEAYQELY